MNIHYQRCIFHIAVFQTEIFFPEEFLEDFNWIGGLFYDSEKRNENQPPQEFILCSFSNFLIMHLSLLLLLRLFALFS